MAERQSDLTRDTLAVLFLFALIAASTWILLPFLTAVVWATMIVVATWPTLLMLQRWLLGRRWLAVTVMTLLLLAIFLLPFLFAIGTFIQNFKEITAWTTSLATFTVPPPPDWVVGLREDVLETIALLAPHAHARNAPQSSTARG